MTSDQPATPTIPGTIANFTIDDLIREARREKTMRDRVYPGRVERGQMTVSDMNKKCDMMQCIAIVLEQVKAYHWPEKQGGLGI
jgi:hypothetical protein